MAKKPNYSFEKQQRERAKAAKREAKREQRAAARAEKKQGEQSEAEAGDAATPPVAADAEVPRD